MARLSGCLHLPRTYSPYVIDFHPEVEHVTFFAHSRLDAEIRCRPMRPPLIWKSAEGNVVVERGRKEETKTVEAAVVVHSPPCLE